MSDPVRIAVVAEGPTDTVVLEAILRAVIPGHEIVVTQLQPEHSLAFGELGGGWTGVYRWCKQSAMRGHGRLGSDPLPFLNHDALILQLDADVAGQTYPGGNIDQLPGDATLPCELPCPPASASTLALRKVLLSWCGESEPPLGVVTCIPSKSTEAWVVAALFPDDREVRKGATFECHADPAKRLGQQRKSQRFNKTQAHYRRRVDALAAGWPHVVGVLQEARRFQAEMSRVLTQ